WRGLGADVSTGPAVVGVIPEILACPVAHRPIRRAFAARPEGTVGRRCSADVSTDAAIVGIKIQEGAHPVAANGAGDAATNAVAVGARGVLVRTGLPTRVAAGSAVVEVVCNVAAHVAAAGAADALGGSVTRPASCEARVLVRLPATFAEGSTRVSAGKG